MMMMLREGARAPPPPPIPASPPPPQKPGHIRLMTAEEHRGRLVNRTRQASNLREKIVQLASRKEKQEAAGAGVFLTSPQHPGKQQQQHQQQQQQNDSPEEGQDVLVHVFELNSSGDVGTRKTGAGYSRTDGGHCGEQHSRLRESQAGVSASTERAVGQYTLLDAHSQNRAPDSSLFPRSGVRRFRSFVPSPPAVGVPGKDASQPAPKNVDTPGASSQRNPSGMPSYPENPPGTFSRQYRSQRSRGGQLHDGSLGENPDQRHATIKPVTGSTTTAKSRSRTSALGTTARSLRTPAPRTVPTQQASEDGQETSTLPTSPRSQDSHGKLNCREMAGRIDLDEIPKQTGALLKGRMTYYSSSSSYRLRESQRQPESEDSSGYNAHGELPDENATTRKEQNRRSSDPRFSPKKAHKQPADPEDCVKRSKVSEDLPKDNAPPPPSKHIPRCPPHPPAPPRGGRSVTVRRAARALRASHATPLPPQGKSKERGTAGQHSKTVRFLPEDSARRNCSSGSSGGSPRQAASRGMEETVGEVKGNALPPTPHHHHHLHPPMGPRRADHKNPSHFASSLEMFKRRLKMNQQRIVTERNTEEDDYVIRLETITPIAERTWKHASGVKPRPPPPPPQLPSEPPSSSPQQLLLLLQYEGNHYNHRGELLTSENPPHHHTYSYNNSRSHLQHLQHLQTSDYGFGDLSSGSERFLQQQQQQQQHLPTRARRGVDGEEAMEEEGEERGGGEGGEGGRGGGRRKGG